MERQEEKEGAAITVKKKTKGKGGRQAKLTGSNYVWVGMLCTLHVNGWWVCCIHYMLMVIFFSYSYW